MIRLVNRGTGNVLGTVQEAELEVLRAALEEEGTEDRDYYVEVEQSAEHVVRIVDKARGVLLRLPLGNPLARYIKVGDQQLPELVV